VRHHPEEPLSSLTAATVTRKQAGRDRARGASVRGRLDPGLIAPAPRAVDPRDALLSLYDRPPLRLVGSAGGAHERHCVVAITGGTLALSFVNPAAAGDTAYDIRARAVAAEAPLVALEWAGGFTVESDELDDDGRGDIVQWSEKSRARMMRKVAGLDLSPLLVSGDPLGMGTLTMPGHWLGLTPDNDAFQSLVSRFRKRFARYVGRPLVGIWKREFQYRGAPHLHFLAAFPAMVTVGVVRPRLKRFRVVGEWEPDGLRLPRVGVYGRDWSEIPYEDWQSLHWADIVDAPGNHFARHWLAGTAVDFSKSPYMLSGVDLARYFLKHGSKTSDGKEYQHVSPWVDSSAGRFWGVWGLSVPVEGARVSEAEGYKVKRVLRRWDRANSNHYGRRRRRSLGMAGRYGAWVLVDDPVRFVGQVLRAAGVAPLAEWAGELPAGVPRVTIRPETVEGSQRSDVLCDVCGGRVEQPGEAQPPWAPQGPRVRHLLCGS